MPLDLKDLVKAYAQVFGSKNGQIVLDDLERRFHVRKTVFVAGDPHASTHREGQRTVPLWIKYCLEIAADPKRLESAGQSSYAEEGDIG